MIWVVFAILVLCTLLGLAPALLESPQSEDAETESYFAQIDALEARDDLDADETEAARTTLQRQLLARREAVAGLPRLPALAGLVVLLALGALAAYLPVGRPDLASGTQTVAQDADSLVAQLERRLATDRADDPQGWTLYANILLQSERYAEAVTALERAIALGNDSPDMAARLEQARSIAAREAMAAGMSEDERAAMIDAMVDGLAARLETQPDDPDGWTRLLRARTVQGQVDQRAIDEARMREVFADRPDVIAQILADAER